jgi:hypothetical protein
MTEQIIEPIKEGNRVVLRRFWTDIFSKQDFRIRSMYGPFASEEEARERYQQSLSGCPLKNSLGFEHSAMMLAGKGNPDTDYEIIINEESIPTGLRVLVKAVEFELTGLEKNCFVTDAAGLAALYKSGKDISLYASNGGVNYDNEKEFLKFRADTNGRDCIGKEDLLKRFGLDQSGVLGLVKFDYQLKEFRMPKGIHWGGKYFETTRYLTISPIGFVPELIAREVTNQLAESIRKLGYPIRKVTRHETSAYWYTPEEHRVWNQVGINVARRRLPHKS